jgi:ATP-dependent helicase/nuclease subunit B
VSSALYVKLGGKQGLDKPREATSKNEPLAQAQEKHYQGLLELLNQFRNPETPYLSRPFPQFESKATEYDHLSRYREWSAGDDGEGA